MSSDELQKQISFMNEHLVSQIEQDELKLNDDKLIDQNLVNKINNDKRFKEVEYKDEPKHTKGLNPSKIISNSKSLLDDAINNLKNESKVTSIHEYKQQRLNK